MAPHSWRCAASVLRHGVVACRGAQAGRDPRHAGAAADRVRGLSWQAGRRREEGRDLSTPRRQARRLPLQPVDQFPRGTTQVCGDELHGGLSVRRLPEGDRGVLLQAQACVSCARLHRIARSACSRQEHSPPGATRSRHLPACIACHGRELTGMAPAIPGLAGLSADYIGAQMGAWKSRPTGRARTGLHGAASPTC